MSEVLFCEVLLALESLTRTDAGDIVGWRMSMGRLTVPIAFI